MLRHYTLAVAVLGAALAASVGCGRSQQPNVIIVLVDTMRPDRLGVYGNGRGLTPAIDDLASRGTVFHRAYAQSSWTNPSVASLFTSRYQSQHGIISFAATLGDEEETLAELFKRRGYSTGGFVANVLLRAKGGFAQGFDEWKLVTRPDPAAPPDSPVRLKGRGNEVNSAVFDWLDEPNRHRGPVFLYVHYMEPHAPYDPPEERIAAQRQHGPPPDREAVNRFFTLPGLPMPDALLPDAKVLYDAEVASVDAAIGALMSGLRSRGLLDDAIMVLLSDHGEELKEHGRVGHDQTLYEEVIRVALIMVATARTQAIAIEQPVSVIDIGPTLLELTGAPRQASFEGRSLANWVGRNPWWAAVWGRHDAQPPSQPVYSELIKGKGMLRLTPHERATVQDSTKLITGVDGARSYYDLAADPGEVNPDAMGPDKRVALDSALNALHFARDQRRDVAVDAETREHMRALGYVE
jgi:arylsulfatase A-like enzyme